MTLRERGAKGPLPLYPTLMSDGGQKVKNSSSFFASRRMEGDHRPKRQACVRYSIDSAWPTPNLEKGAIWKRGMTKGWINSSGRGEAICQGRRQPKDFGSSWGDGGQVGRTEKDREEKGKQE